MLRGGESVDAESIAAAVTPSSDVPQETLDYFHGDDLRAHVFFDKYALRDLDGRVLERTPVEMWRRIAREMASVEATAEKRREWEEQFYWLLEDFRFIPGGRIMHGAGNHKRVTLLNCFPAGTPVFAKRGVLPIESVLPGDEVLTHQGRFRLVTHVIERDIAEPIVELAFWYLNDQPIRCTLNHRFLAADREGRVAWIPAQELTAHHYVRVGRITETVPREAIDVLDYLDAGAREDENESVYTATRYVGGQGAVGLKESRRISRWVSVNEQFGRWLGYFVSEGGVTEHSVYFTFSKDERHLADEVAELTKSLFGLSAMIQTRTEQPGHWLRVYVHAKLLVQFVQRFF